MGGTRVSKAKRGKRRWIGFSVPEDLAQRSELENYLKEHMETVFPWKLFDLERDEEGIKAILRVRLEDYQAALENMNLRGLTSLTSSGKIRLVRKRLGLPPRPRKRKR